MFMRDEAVVLVAARTALEAFRDCALVDLTFVPGRHLHLLKAAFALGPVERTLVAELTAHPNDRHRLGLWRNTYKNSLPQR
jgi:hypothetical protein